MTDMDDEHGIYEPEAEGWSSFEMNDWQMVGCIVALVGLVFIAGLVIGALWL